MKPSHVRQNKGKKMKQKQTNYGTNTEEIREKLILKNNKKKLRRKKQKQSDTNRKLPKMI